MMWIVSRNSTGRPTLMHAVETYSDLTTRCNVYVGGWSRFFMSTPLPYIACKKCVNITGFGEAPVEESRPRLALVSSNGR